MWPCYLSLSFSCLFLIKSTSAMACCEKKCTIIAEQEAWFARCEHCDRVVLKPIQEGFKWVLETERQRGRETKKYRNSETDFFRYFKVSCSKPSEEQKAKIASYPYYRIKVDESFLTCTCCFREYNIGISRFDTLLSPLQSLKNTIPTSTSSSTLVVSVMT